MLLHSLDAARIGGRRLILLADQDRDRWNRDQIAEGSALVSAP
jgi:predicted RNA polymerase sigma factor